MKVFVSSTYKDLIDYRAAAIRAVEGTTYQASKMEVFGARTGEPVKACLEEVEGSGLFIGIYALRYGYIPDGADISITEMEYLHAKKLGRQILCFILDEENQPWLTKWIEGEPGKSKLKAFKERIQKEHTCAFFTSAEDLGMKVANALSRYVATETRSDDPPAITPRSAPCGSTLPKQPFFFGRIEERKTIAAALSPETRAWGALIDGPGGIGKTALAIKAAHEAPDDLFDRKIFITAKVRELTPDGEAKLTDFTRPSYIAMLDELGKELGEENLSRLAPEERPNTVRLALAGKKALIVFDNLETLPEEERTRLFQFLSRLPDGNKAIVTSRRRTDVDARIIRLERLLPEEAMQLLDELANGNPRLKRATPKERDDLYAITQGNPLLIRWIVGQLGRQGSQCRTIPECCGFIDKAPKGNDPLEYIFGDLLETFSENETKVLAALSHFSLPAKVKWIAQMTGLPERSAETALEDLTDRAILTADLEARVFLLPPLAAQFIRTRRPEAVVRTGDELVDRVYALVMEHGGFDNFDGFKTLDDEWNLIAAGLPRFVAGDNGRLQAVCGELAQFFNFTGRWDDWLRLSEQAETRAIIADDKESAGRRTYETGWVYSLQSQPTNVLACAARAAEHWQNSTPHKKAYAIRLRGKGHKLNKDYPSALIAYRDSLDIFRSISPENDDVAMALNDLAEIECKQKDYPAAERDYREALRIAKIIKDDEGTAIYTGNLAVLALAREQWTEAESLVREALPLAEKIGRQEAIASNCQRIAASLLNQNRNLEEALSFARRAVEIKTFLKSPGLPDAQATLSKIEQVLAGK